MSHPGFGLNGAAFNGSGTWVVVGTNGTILTYTTSGPPVIYPAGSPSVQTTEREPLVTLRWSDTGLHWSNPLTETIGSTGKYIQWVKFMQLGLSKSGFRVYEVTCTDPVQIDLIGASLRLTNTVPN